jgi:pyruvate/2-oxoglutarate dehydrogenase complex dihydrolipoamide acyltransferase (E2) component
MSEGILSEWYVEDDDDVREGDPLYLLATDKVENEIAAPASGVIRIVGVAGQTYPVGTMIGEIY